MTNHPDSDKLHHPLSISGHTLDGNIALAPMAGVTDSTFRQICKEQGASLVCTELVSARGMLHDPGLVRSWRYLEISKNEDPVAIQLFGSDPEDFVGAIRLLLEHPLLSGLFALDINMGCPVAKVVKGGAGSALMRSPHIAERIIRASVKTAGEQGIPVTVKFRSGWDPDHVNAPEFARMAEAAGAAALTIHARTASQMYSGQADWNVVAEVKAAVDIPVLGNGDVKSGESAVSMIRQTGVDGIAVGRAALGNPWIFSQVRAAMQGRRIPPLPGLAERSETVLHEMKARIDRMGEANAMREMRKVVLWYLRGTPHASALRRRGVEIREADDLERLLREWQKQDTG